LRWPPSLRYAVLPKSPTPTRSIARSSARFSGLARSPTRIASCPITSRARRFRSGHSTGGRRCGSSVANASARRQALQKVGTKSAKRGLHHLKGRQRRFQKDTNHTISKRLVAKAERTKRMIALEDLSGIRTRVRVSGPRQRARHSNWAFRQLRAFISYKAQLAGVRVELIDPAYTSQRCSACGRTERRNRKSQAGFEGVPSHVFARYGNSSDSCSGRYGARGLSCRRRAVRRRHQGLCLWLLARAHLMPSA
jgi:IS605 OrfB family transposase